VRTQNKTTKKGNAIKIGTQEYDIISRIISNINVNLFF